MRKWILLAMIAGAGVGCGGDDGGTPDAGIEPTWSSIYENLFVGNCTIACHGATQIPVMDTAESAYTNLVGVDSTTMACSTSTYVAPMLPDSSLLVQVLGPGSCATQMPLGGTAFTPAQIDIIRTWINLGAPNN